MAWGISVIPMMTMTEAPKVDEPEIGREEERSPDQPEHDQRQLRAKDRHGVEDERAQPFGERPDRGIDGGVDPVHAAASPGAYHTATDGRPRLAHGK